LKKYKGNRISKFDIFYRDHPNKKKIDDAIRKLPELGEPGAKGFHPLNSLFQLSSGTDKIRTTTNVNRSFVELGFNKKQTLPDILSCRCKSNQTNKNRKFVKKLLAF